MFTKTLHQRSSPKKLSAFICLFCLILEFSEKKIHKNSSSKLFTKTLHQVFTAIYNSTSKCCRYLIKYLIEWYWHTIQRYNKYLHDIKTKKQSKQTAYHWNSISFYKNNLETTHSTVKQTAMYSYILSKWLFKF